MTDVQQFDPADRAPTPQRGGEMEMLRAFLTYKRDTLRWKCAGLTQEQLAYRHAPSALSLGGLMKHLALVESQWFDHWLSGRDFAPPFDQIDWQGDEDWEFITAAQDSPSDLRDLFDAAVARSDATLDAALAGSGLDTESARPHPQTGEPWSLRWILLHMIEEYSRHLGHADLIREALDGQRG